MQFAWKRNVCAMRIDEIDVQILHTAAAIDAHHQRPNVDTWYIRM